MCGIVAYSGIDPYNIDKIKLLLTYNSLERGSDALGIYSPSIGIIKKAGDPIDLMSELLPKEADNFFIGHVRAATVGDKSKDENAHPFERGEYIGVMNGTIKDYSSLITKRNLTPSDYSVDSDAIMAMIDADNNYSCLREINGGCAILTVKKDNPNTLVLWRNNERPLYRGKLGNGMYISSIHEALDIIGCTDIKEISPENLYTIRDGAVIKNKVHKKEEPKFDINPDRWKLIDHLFEKGQTVLELYDFVGRWIQCDAPGYDDIKDYTNPCKLRHGEWYLCVGFNKSTNSLKVLTDKISREIVLTAFDKKSSFFKYEAPVKIITDLYCDKVKIASAGDIMYFYGGSSHLKKYTLYKNGSEDYVTGEAPYSVPSDCFRNLSSQELYNFKKAKLDFNVQAPIVFNKEDVKTNSDIITNNNALEEEEKDDTLFIDKETLEEFYSNIQLSIKDFKHTNNYDYHKNTPYMLINTADLRQFLETIDQSVDDFVMMLELTGN